MVSIHPGQAYEAQLSAGPPAMANQPSSKNEKRPIGEVGPDWPLCLAGVARVNYSLASPIWLVSRIQASWETTIKPRLPPSRAEYATGSEAVKRTQT